MKIPECFHHVRLSSREFWRRIIQEEGGQERLREKELNILMVGVNNRLVESILEANGQTSITVIDISPREVRKAQRDFKDNDQVTILRKDALHVGADEFSEGFNFVLAFNFIHFKNVSVGNFIVGISKLLNEGGKVFCSTPIPYRIPEADKAKIGDNNIEVVEKSLGIGRIFSFQQKTRDEFSNLDV